MEAKLCETQDCELKHSFPVLFKKLSDFTFEKLLFNLQRQHSPPSRIIVDNLNIGLSVNSGN